MPVGTVLCCTRRHDQHALAHDSVMIICVIRITLRYCGGAASATVRELRTFAGQSRTRHARFI